MKITIEPTSRFVYLEVDGASVPARVWEGRTEAGVECYLLVTRIAVHKDADQSEFERNLTEQVAPSVAAVEAFPLRMVL